MGVMYIVKAYRGTSDGKPLAVVAEVEAVQHGERTLYRHVRSGRVEPICEWMGEKVVETREDAVVIVEKMLDGFADEYRQNCREAVERLRAEGVVTV
jgi:uncharacterized NAD-dependent epimerase/dehydratase family protein